MIEIIPNWHPIFVHFSIALFATSAILFVLTKFATHWRLEDQWLATAYWNLWMGMIISVGTVTAGVLAYYSVKHDVPSHAAMLVHIKWAAATVGTFLILSIWGAIQYRAQQRPHLMFVIAMAAAALLLFTTAWHGGELVYRHGLGVISLPKVDEHSHGGEGGHSHEHGDGGSSDSHHEESVGDHHEQGAESSDHHRGDAATGSASPVGEAPPAAAMGSDAASPAPEATAAPIGGEGTPSSAPPSQ